MPSLFLASLALVLLGCGKDGAESSMELPKDAKAAATQLEQAFAGNSNAKKHTEGFANAMRQRDFEKALDAMSALQGQTAENIEQALAVERAHRRLQADILEGVERGDPQAIRTWQRLKNSRRN